MPDDEYQEQRYRLVQDIEACNNPSAPLNFQSWKEAVSSGVRRHRGPDRNSRDASRTPRFDWKVVIADYLEASYFMTNFSYRDDAEVIESEALLLGVESSGFLGLSASASSFADIRQLHDILDGYFSKSIDRADKRLSELEKEVSQLRDEVRFLRTSQNEQARGPKFELNRRDNSYEIESLQKDIKRLLTAAALCDAKGDFYGAGSYRGEVTKIESKLRALGA